LHLSDTGGKWEDTVYQLFIDLKKTYDSVLIEFGVPMKLIRLIKMFLNEMCGKVHIGRHLSDTFPYPEWSKIRICFIAVAFQRCFRICHKEGPGKVGVTEIKWGTSAAGLC
jgi:hypothetical protein